MSKMKLLITVMVTLFVFGYLGINEAQASNPILNFSDLINGPSSGLNDSLGGGVIVTVWGNNLGSSQGSSTIKIGGENPAYVYYWKDADGTLPGGPADLTPLELQEVAFSIPSSLRNGTYDIQFTVNGEVSNTLPFTIRAGNIYHAKTTGSSGGNGSFSNPWGSFIFGGGLSGMSAGDILYLHNGVEDINTDVGGYNTVNTKQSTINNQFAVIAYPNSEYLAQAEVSAIHLYNSSAFVFSKLLVRAGRYDEPEPDDQTILPDTGWGDNGFSGWLKWSRIVGNKIMEIPGKCVSGSGGAIHPSTGGAYKDPVSDLKFFGNYIYDYGCNQTNRKEHTTYFTIRTHGEDIDVDPWEIGWNHLKDNKAKYGIHNYDESSGPTGVCNSPNGTVKIHDNYVVNQVAAGINVGSYAESGSGCWTNGSFEIYNNIVVGAGKNTVGAETPALCGIGIYDQGLLSPIHIYNNTVVGWGDDTDGADGSISFPRNNNSGDCTVVVTNNILYDTRGGEYTEIDNSIYTGDALSGSNNLWYSTGEASNGTVDSRLTNNIFANPQFVDFNTNNFRLTNSSPAKDVGVTSNFPSNVFVGMPEDFRLK